MPDYVEAKYVKCKNYRVSKKTGISVQGSFKALKWPKIKKKQENKPHLKFNFTYWEGFSGQFVDCRLWIMNLFNT